MTCKRCRQPFPPDDLEAGLCVSCWDKSLNAQDNKGSRSWREWDASRGITVLTAQDMVSSPTEEAE